jgi:HEAT repeat protein
MNRRKKIALSCAALLVAIIVGIVLFQAEEPGHEGRPLSTWLADLGMPNSQNRAEAEAAVKAMGPDIVPHLITRLKKRDSDLGRRFHKLASSVPFIDVGRPIYEVHFQAAWACRILGDDASDAAPALVALLDEPDASFPVPELVVKYLGEEAVQPLTDALPNANPIIKPEIIRALGSLGYAAEPALPELLKLANGSDRNLQKTAELVILQITDDPTRLMPILLKRLKSSSALDNRDAIYRVGRIGAEARDAVPLLLKIYESGSPEQQRRAIAALRLIDPAQAPADLVASGPFHAEGEPTHQGRGLSAWLEDVVRRDTDSNEPRDRELRALQRKKTNAAIRAMGTNAIPNLLDHIACSVRDGDHNYIKCHTRGLSGIRSLGDTAIPSLLQHLTHENIKRAFFSVGASAVPGLSEAMKDPDPNIRRNAAEVLEFLDPYHDASSAVPSLLAAISDRDLYARLAALKALRHVQADPDRVVPELIAYLTRPKEDPANYPRPIPGGPMRLSNSPSFTLKQTRAAAARAIGAYGPYAELAIIPVVDALRENREDVFRYTSEVLGKLSEAQLKDVIAELERLLAEGGENSKATLYAIIGERGFYFSGAARTDLARALIPSLAKWSLDPKPQHDPLALALALKKLDPEAAAKVMVSLTRRLRSPSPAIREKAANTLGRMGVNGEVVGPELGALLRDPDARVRRAASLAIRKIKSKSRASGGGGLLDAFGQPVGGDGGGLKAVERALSDLRSAQPAKVSAGLFSIDAVAQQTLNGLGPLNDQVVDELARILATGDLKFRKAAPRTLSHIGPAARRAMPAILEAIRAESTDRNVKLLLRMTVLAIDPDAVREVALSHFDDLDHADEAKRDLAYEWVYYARTEARPRLIEIVLREHEREDEAILADALSALPRRGLIEGATDELREVLLKLLSSPNARVQSAAAVRLIDAGVEPARAETEIVKILEGLVGNQRRIPTFALERIRLLRAWSERP